MIKKPKPVLFASVHKELMSAEYQKGFKMGRLQERAEIAFKSNELIEAFRLEIFSDNNSRIDKDRCCTFIKELKELGL